MDKRYQVFVSSTYADLKDERKTVIQTLMEMDCIPAGMELFPAIDDDQWNFIQKVIDDCDYYLIIVGGRYGSVTSEGISYTEKEYDYAVEKGIKVIALLRNNLDSIPVSKTDSDPDKKAKLDAFINKLKTGRLVKFWDNEEQLPGLVALSLTKTIKQYPATGWVRGNQVPNETLLLKLEELRKENEELKKQKDSEQQSTIVTNELKENLANFDDNFTITGTFENTEEKCGWIYSASWRNIFISISPYFLENPSDSEIEEAITRYVTEQDPKLANIAYLKDYSMKTSINSLHYIKIQFMALGLISKEGYWELTDYGKKEMIKGRSVKKQPTP
jgi:hypothetical protein